MKYSYIINEIRTRLNLSQSKLALLLGISPATIDCWENGLCQPSQIEINALKVLCNNNNVDFTQFESTHIISSDKKVMLYHGSKSGIKGAIAPISRSHCDFGKGFYMGSDKNQPLTLICNYPEARLYTLSLNLSGLRILDLDVCLDWALFVAFNRGKMDFVKNSEIYTRFSTLCHGCDIVIGHIANDRMFVVLDRFFNGEITDIALINCLSALKLGMQYVALTETACSRIEITDEISLAKENREQIRQASESNRIKGISMAEEICRKYRRNGRFFDEILKGEKYGDTFA